MDFMNEGGNAMWLMVVSAIAVLVVGFTRSAEKRSFVFSVGSFLMLVEGMLGLASGMKAVAAFAANPKFAELHDQAATIGQGLGEFANNGILAAFLALVLGVAALVVRRASLPAADKAR